MLSRHSELILKENTMDQKVFANPFHEGEVKAQQIAGVGNVAEWAGGFIRKILPQQHREFFSALPFIIASGEDADGKIWITLLEGKQGFISSPDPQSLLLETKIDQQDPLANAFENKAEIGVVGIELATRRRNRFSGQIEKTDNGRGWKEFVAMKDLQKKFVHDGKLTVKAQIRVRRSTNANLNLTTT